MNELELLGLHPDGDKLSLNDADGNRYLLPITDELRAALRKDRYKSDTGEPKPITPREIQAHFRAGRDIAEVSEISSLPPSQLAGLAHPIFAERQYTAQVARNFRQGQDLGGMTLEELVVSRLIPRGVDASTITWDAIREAGSPWILIATYCTAGKETRAQWRINSKAQSVEALDDEALWLTETQIPAPSSPWRPLNTPAMEAPVTSISSIAAAENSGSEKSGAGKSTGSSSDSDSSSNIVGKTNSQEQPAQPDIDAVLASLNSQRGVARPMPSDEEFFDGAHPARSAPEEATDATILQFPSRDCVDPTNSHSSEDPTYSQSSTNSVHTSSSESSKAHSESNSEASKESVLKPVDSGAAVDHSDADSELDLGTVTKVEDKPKKKRNRPTMPAWDEIIFGAPKSDA